MYWELHQSKYTKMELKFYIFTHSNFFTWKSFLKKYFEVQSWGTRIFRILRNTRNFPKIYQKFTNRPLVVGDVAKSTLNYFLELQETPAVKMSHIAASYDHFWWFYIFLKFHFFRHISWKSHFRWFARMRLCGKKPKKSRKSFFA